MKRIIIAAVAENGAIGKDNDLIWHLPDDMQFFKVQTVGKPVVMGRKNYESIPPRYRPLPGRENVIITRNPNYEAPGCIIFHDIEAALDALQKEGNNEAYIIGGSEIYKLALQKNLVDEMLLTQIHESFEADAFFPEFTPDEWTVEVLSKHPKDEKHPHAFTIKRFVKRAMDE
jgi:dihydrofolate reductase